MANPNKVGLVFGSLLGGWHLLWSLLVLLGLGQPIFDFILWAHMIHLQVVIGPFELMTSAVLIITTAIGGYVLGYIAGTVWNRLHH